MAASNSGHSPAPASATIDSHALSTCFLCTCEHAGILLLVPSVFMLLIYEVQLGLFDISILNIDCRYIDTFEKYRDRYRYRYGQF